MSEELKQKHIREIRDNTLFIKACVGIITGVVFTTALMDSYNNKKRNDLFEKAVKNDSTLIQQNAKIIELLGTTKLDIQATNDNDASFQDAAQKMTNDSKYIDDEPRPQSHMMKNAQ